MNQSKYDVLTIISISLLLLLFIINLQIILYPYPLESREGATLQTTVDVMNGVNSFSKDKLPNHTNVYGILYHVISVPFMKMFGVSLQSQRIVTAVFSILSCIILYQFLRHYKIDKKISIILIAIFYTGMLINTTPLTRPDSLGLFLFLLGLYVPLKYNYSYGSLLISALIGIVAFFAKSFFLLLYPYLFVYLLFFESKSKAFYFLIISIFLGVFTVFLINFLWLPNYISITYFTNRNFADFRIYHLARQSAFYILNNLIIIGAILYLYRDKFSDFKFIQNTIARLKNLKFDLLDFNQPIVKNVKIECYVVYLIVTILVLLFLIGGHIGGKMTYYYQLIPPFLLIIIGRSYHESKLKFNTYRTILIANLIFMIIVNEIVTDYFFNINRSKDSWEKIERMIDNSENVLNNAGTAYYLVKTSRYVWDNGQTEFFKFSYLPDNFKFLGYYPNSFLTRTAVDSLIMNYKDRVMDKIKKSEFDLIISGGPGYNFPDDSVISAFKYTPQIVQIEYPPMNKIFEFKLWKLSK